MSAVAICGADPFGTAIAWLLLSEGCSVRLWRYWEREAKAIDEISIIVIDSDSIPFSLTGLKPPPYG